jgi:hypothetical protein
MLGMYVCSCLARLPSASGPFPAKYSVQLWSNSKNVFTKKHRTRCAGARQLTQCQKRPTTVSKETYYSVKRDLSVISLDDCLTIWLSHYMIVSFYLDTFFQLP